MNRSTLTTGDGPDNIRERLVASASAARRPALFLDFDGVLSEIVDNPRDAVAIDGTHDIIVQLIDAGFSVTIVSSRDLSFLTQRFEQRPGLILSGSAGLERMIAGDVEIDSEAEGLLPMLDAAEAQANERAPQGIDVERKSFGLSIHYRTRPELQEEVENLGRELADQYSLEDGTGRKVVELRLPIAKSKASPIREQMDPSLLDNQERAFDWALFAGDDEPDIAGFAELRRIRQSAHHVEAYAVGVRPVDWNDNEELRNEFVAAVDYLVDDPEALQDLLRELIDRRSA